jgi:hypothetical protein
MALPKHKKSANSPDEKSFVISQNKTLTQILVS